MRSETLWLVLLGLTLAHVIQARKIRVQPRLLPQDEQGDEGIEYYAAEPAQDRQRVVLDNYNGLYGEQTASARQDNYLQRSPAKGQTYVQRVKEAPREPPVQTIRNYNKVNDDGSFTFGYEAADGSFKEETRGTDCVVRGKYGYVDPDGNKREFTYVSGNPCDPNAPKEEDDEPNESAENENVPANYPTRPIRPIQRPVSTPKPVTLFQSQYDQGEDEQPEPEQLLRPTPAPIRSRPQYIARPQYQSQSEQPVSYRQQQAQPSSTPASTVYRQQVAPVTITPRPIYQTASPTSSTRAQLPPTTFRPQLLQVSPTPRPSLLYTPKAALPSPSPTKGIDFDAEFQRFQQENDLGSPATAGKARPDPVGQVYSSALLYDAATGQYNNQLYQSLPQSEGQFGFNQRIQPYVHQQQQQQQQRRPPVNLQLQAQPTPLYRQQQINPQAVYQAQQAEVQFQNSAQLYAQQQKARQQQQATSVAPPVYYIQPSVSSTGALGAGQIDAFLRGHNIQF
ncbi:bromodomain-containing protein DDB_G0280777 isoform X2 [Dendroctonus ponderosae]|uniref:bromodomain-containing protein DDB_G0280777 isoform X2 n=1 Tax=Dendroctonus ponderosae TaxID=77166 RepID=UPI00203659DB|nr:bromodomain-containing protein DDB_G0280777 isoform X2 [Dendroctonus ponderosae]